jgi:DNA-binding NarL/FixJ family response regulator
MTIRVLIADDQSMVRIGFRLILESEPDMEVVAEASDGEEAVRKSIELKPDVTVMDIRMPGLNGIEATRLLAGRNVADPLRVLVVTTYDTDENVYTALRAGAVGFLLKDSSPPVLIDAVRTAFHGESLISPTVLTRLLHQWSPQSKRPTPPQEVLTPRELDIAREVARGRTNAELASDLNISVTTVKTHLAAVQRKVGARNRTEVAVWAWESRQIR